MKTFRALLGAFLLLGSCFAQTVLSCHSDIVLDQNGQPIGGATIRVCANTATGIPCNSLASIFKDRAGTLPLGDSAGNFLADDHGNYKFCAASNVYQIQTTGIGVTVTTKDVLLPCDPANGVACAGGAAAVPTGTGFRHITSNVEDAASTPVPICLDLSGQHLNYNPATNVFTCGTSGGFLNQFQFVGVGQGGLVGAFTDSGGVVKGLLDIGDGPITFTVPSGATQLQLGTNDDLYADNLGSFNITASVSGGATNTVTVPGTAQPWNFSGSLNTSFTYGLNDGTSPVVALTGLTSGDSVTIQWNSGTVNVGAGFSPFTDANGWGAPDFSRNWPTQYMPQNVPTTSSIGGSALAAGACASTTLAFTGAATSMVVSTTPNTYPGDGFFWKGYVSATNTVTVKVCAAVAGTPTASTYNVRIVR